MGLLQKFKTLLKTSSLHRRELDDDGNCLTHVRPASATTPRTVTATVENDNVRPVSPSGANGSGATQAASSANTWHVDSIRTAVPRIDSVTTKAVGASRFETTIITRQGSRLVLQGVMTMKPDSDDEAEDTDEGPVAPNSPPSALPPSATVPVANSSSFRHAASPSQPSGHLPSAAAATATTSLPAGGPSSPSANPASPPPPPLARRKPNRVASLPMLLDGGMPRAPRPMVAEDAPAPEYAGPQEPEPKLRRPPKRAESLKYLLHLDQYRFNQDESVQEAREAACGGPGGLGGGLSIHITPQGSLEDIMSADASTHSILAVSAALPARMRRPRWSLEDYQLLKQLHRGYASDVYQARCRISGEMVALKVYKLAEQGDIQRMQLYREIKLHARLRHSNIVQYYACFLEQQRVVLVAEFATGGDLLRIMYKCGGRLFERQAVNLVLQPFLAALHYLHTQGIVHRDIKPENVLFAEGKVLKLADFGLAINLKEERANTRAGTLDYMAPEVLRCPTKKTPDENKNNPQSAHYHQSVDAWAVGVFAYELIVGAPPFKAGQMIDTARNIMHAPVSFPDTVSDLAKDFISRALHKDYTERLTVIEMLHHPWITMFQRRSSVRIVYTRSNSLMELMPPTPDGAPPGGAAGGGHGGDGGASGEGGGGRRALVPSGSARHRGGGAGGVVGPGGAEEQEQEQAGGGAVWLPAVKGSSSRQGMAAAAAAASTSHEDRVEEFHAGGGAGGGIHRGYGGPQSPVGGSGNGGAGGWAGAHASQGYRRPMPLGAVTDVGSGGGGAGGVTNLSALSSPSPRGADPRVKSRMAPLV